MAHRSKKKHLKHLREKDLGAPQPRAKAPGAKATSAALGSETSHKTRLTTKAKAATAAVRARAKKAAPAVASASTKAKRPGIVRSIAKAATDKLTAKPKRMMSRAKARVRSMLGVSPAPDAAE